TRRQNRTSRRLSRAPSPRRPAGASSSPGGGGPSVAVLPGLRHGSSSPDHSDGSTGAAPGPASGGRCNVTPSPAGRSSGRGARRDVPFAGDPFDGAARGTPAAPGRTQGSPSDSLIDDQT